MPTLWGYCPINPEVDKGGGLCAGRLELFLVVPDVDKGAMLWEDLLEAFAVVADVDVV